MARAMGFWTVGWGALALVVGCGGGTSSGHRGSGGSAAAAGSADLGGSAGAVSGAGAATPGGHPGAGGSGAASAGASGAGGAVVWPPALSYTPTGANLTDPTRNLGFVTDCADFWLTARDDVYGGFATFVSRTGEPSTVQTDKWCVGQSRDAYGFVRAFMVSGDTAYLGQARHALDFLYAHCWDAEHEGWYEWTLADGTPVTPLEPKWSFVQHYALLGITTMCEATQNPLDCEWLDTGLRVLDEHLWDPVAGGYFNWASYSWANPHDKGFTPTADGITTNALYSYLITRDPVRKARFLALADDLADHLVASLDHPNWKFGFAEEYASDWTVLETETYGFVGHVFKAAWCLARAYLIEPKAKYRDGAQRLLDHLWDDGGFDRTVGAPNYDFLWDTGLTRREKEFWQVEQGFTSGLVNFYIATEPEAQARYLEIADRSLDFMMTRLLDPEYGELYALTTEDGLTVLDTTKGGAWKAAYHSTETGYYGYLYGNLMYHRAPVTLHYRFEPAPAARSIPLYPLAIEDAKLKLVSVTRDGAPFTTFDRDTRTLEVPANVGGTFAVVFERID